MLFVLGSSPLFLLKYQTNLCVQRNDVSVMSSLLLRSSSPQILLHSRGVRRHIQLSDLVRKFRPRRGFLSLPKLFPLNNHTTRSRFQLNVTAGSQKRAIANLRESEGRDESRFALKIKRNLDLNCKSRSLTIFCHYLDKEGEGILLNDRMTSDKNCDHEPSTGRY